VFCTDLFFLSRVEAAARQLGVSFASVGAPEQLSRLPGQPAPALALIDLSLPNLDVSAAVAAARELGAETVVAFGPHRDVGARARALAAGCDRWLPNSRLVAELPALLRGHGCASPRTIDDGP
jgi:CheY-like chemotaxis protein